MMKVTIEQGRPDLNKIPSNCPKAVKNINAYIYIYI